jgi:predicted DNA-binding transcriptional regulator AlpA
MAASQIPAKATAVSKQSKPQDDMHRLGTLLTIQELAERLTVSVGCIRAWRLRGDGPPAIRVGTALRWDSREVDEWLDIRRESRWQAGRLRDVSVPVVRGSIALAFTTGAAMWRRELFKENVMRRNGNGARRTACGPGCGLIPQRGTGR